ncbi:MAG TPA: bifunctional 3-phosphoshikimate 1-carboxyvinyltransferase/cytidylate kinase [Burkholderiales bacterium]|nr:bifunctional 3-phosphoshikimate 1-carboxyvinyltransferase/cytidylate kinase [Burkholderiales bacterium]
MPYPPYLDLGPLHRAAGVVRLPGSKSISNRTLLLAALAQGQTRILDLLDADDVDRMLDALGKLGVRIDRGVRAGEVLVTGCPQGFAQKRADLFLGNAGTAFRPLTAVLAVLGGHYTLSGVARMHERPIRDLVDALRELGADVQYRANEGYPPLEIRPGNIRGGHIRVRGDVSSQFLTALLMALPLTGSESTVEVVGELISKPYVDITLNLMARFGVTVQRQHWSRFTIPAASRYVSPGEVHVEGDASGASYFLAAGAIGGGPVRVEGVGRHSIQGDVHFADALAAMGVRIEMGDTWIEARAPGDGRLRPLDMDLNHIPDAAMTLAVVALFAQGRSRLRNIASWRVKETDRIAAMAAELRKLGATVEEGADFLAVTPPPGARLAPHARIDTYDDHRMAMCFSLAALGGVPVRINEPGCVAKTFPDYFDRFALVTWDASAPVIAIDGPSASGKGTVAERVAAALGFHYLDSGALYRLVALAASQEGIALDDEARLGRLAATLPVEFRAGRAWLRGRDATDAIRTEDMSAGASRVAAIPAVRQGLMMRQRAFRQAPGLVADGRDMGSIVFPDATLKIFLTASVEERAQRRLKQLKDKGFDANLATLLQDLRQRDERDSTRSVAPLHKSAEAQMLDTTDISIEAACSRVIEWFQAAQRRVPSR